MAYTMSHPDNEFEEFMGKNAVMAAWGRSRGQGIPHFLPPCQGDPTAGDESSFAVEMHCI